MIQILKDGLKSLNYSIQNYQEEQIIKYINLYKLWQNKISLSTIKGDDDILIRHFLDSIIPILKFIPPKIFQRNIIDLGSGTGFPGIAIKIFYPEAKIDLAEVTKKKIEFLNEIIQNLNYTDMHIINSSFKKVEKKYDILFTRAFGSFDKILTESKKYLTKDSEIFIYKGQKKNFEDELNFLKKKKFNWFIQCKNYTVPFIENEERNLIQIKFKKKILY